MYNDQKNKLPVNYIYKQKAIETLGLQRTEGEKASSLRSVQV